jgi:protein-tyrosine-phosphatase
MNVLFICKYNRFRSQIAESYYNKICCGSVAKSAGIKFDIPIDNEIIYCAKQSGLEITDIPKLADDELLSWADKIIIVANNVEKICFKEKYHPKIICWDVPDVDNGQIEKRLETIERIKTKIDEFIKK